jgi:hypothetical protein
MDWLKILIINYPLVKCPNKKPRIPNFTIDGPLFFFFFPICKKINIPFFLFSCIFSSTPSLLLHAQVCLLLLSFFLFSGFLINILYEFICFSLLSFTCNYIKVNVFLFFSFFVFFSLYLFLFYFKIFFVLNNCMNVVVGFVFHMWTIFSWFIYRIFKFLAIATSFFSYEFYLVEFIFLCYLFVTNLFELIFFFLFPSNPILSIIECWFILI